MKKIKENAYRLSGNLYVALNQNGFNNSLYDFFEDYGYSKAKIRECAQNYPKKYPCVFSINDDMFECSRFSVSIVKSGTFSKLLEIVPNL